MYNCPELQLSFCTTGRVQEGRSRRRSQVKEEISWTADPLACLPPFADLPVCATDREEAKARDASPDRQFLPGGGDMMGGDDSFAAAKMR